jgi:hypothetical protein
VGQGERFVTILGDRNYIFDQSTWADSTTPPTPLLRRSRYVYSAVQGTAEGVNGVLHRVPRVRVVCVGCLAPVLVTCTVLVEAVDIRLR